MIRLTVMGSFDALRFGSVKAGTARILDTLHQFQQAMLETENIQC